MPVTLSRDDSTEIAEEAATEAKKPQNLVLQTFKILTSFALSNHIQIMSQALTKLCNYLSSPVERKKQLFGISKYKLEIWKNNLTGNLERQIWKKLLKNLARNLEKIWHTAASSHPLPSRLLYTRSPSILQ